MLSTTTERSPQSPATVAREPTILERLAGLEATAVRLAEERDAANLRAAQRTEERDAASHRAERAESYGVALSNQVVELTERCAWLAQRAADAEAMAERALATASAERSARERTDAENRLLRAQVGRRPRTVKRRPWRTRTR